MQTATKTIMALDVGSRRIGVALAGEARLAQPLKTLESATALEKIEQLARQENVGAVVVGLPRSLNGQTTKQTEQILSFIKELKSRIPLPVYEQDEAVTSRQAETELKARRKPYSKGDIDALAATYILEDFLREYPEVGNE